MQLKEKPELNPINQESEFLAKTYQPDRPIKERKSVTTTLLKIIFIYFPLVGILLTILAAIALPYVFGSRCDTTTRGKGEAKHYVNVMNKGQQAIYAEEGAFSKSMKGMGIGLKTQTTHYKYSIIATKNAAFSYGVSIRETKDLTSYVGAVFLVPVSKAANNEKTTVSILCAANTPGNTQPSAPILQKGNPVCATGSSLVTK